LREVTPVDSKKLSSKTVVSHKRNILINKKVKNANETLYYIWHGLLPDRVINRNNGGTARITKESILLDIAGQNLAGKPCLQASGKALMQGRLEFKAHGFHR
jgi:hypothetical protein